MHVVGLRRVMQTLLCLIWAIFALMIVDSDTYVLHIDSEFRDAVLFAALVATFLRYMLSEAWLARVAKNYPSYGEPHLQPAEVPDLHALADYYHQRFLSLDLQDAVAWTVAALAYPSSVVPRISQSFEVRNKRWGVRVSRLIRLESDAQLFPVHRVRKGSIAGGLKVQVGEKRASTLLYSESKGLVLSLFESAWYKALAASERQPEADSAAVLLEEIRVAIVAPKELPASGYNDLVARSQAFLIDSKVAILDRNLVVFLVRLLLAFDLIFVRIPTESLNSTSRVSIEYDLFADHTLHGGVNRIRAALGIGARSFSFPIPCVSDTQSFHLDVVGPAGMYVYHASPVWPLQGRSEAPPLNPSPERVRNEDLATSPYSGDERIHLYMRDFDGRPIFEDDGGNQWRRASLMPRFDVEFREVPPGLVGAILAVAAWLLVLTWAVGIYHSDIFKATGGTPSVVGSWPTLIFGIPALVTGWLLSRASASTIRIISIPSFLVLVWLACNSAALITVVAFKSAGIESDAFIFILPWLGPQQMVHPTWTVLMLSVFLNFAATLSMFITKSSRYAAVINGKD